MLVFCWNPVVSVLLVLVRRPLVPRPPYFLCRVGGIAFGCCRDFSSGCFSCARDLFFSDRPELQTSPGIFMLHFR